MSMMVRMLEKQKWASVNLSTEDHTKTPADAITSDLRTRSNTLSLWLINTRDELVNAVLALAVGRKQITRLDVMILEKDIIEEKGLTVVNSPESGLSPIEEYNDYHYDLIGMDYLKLGILSEIILDNLDNPENCIRFDKKDIGDIIYEGYKSKKFNIEELDAKLQGELLKVINRKENM